MTNATPPTGLIRQALWNLRLALIFILGPAFSVSLVGMIFSMPVQLRLMALFMLALALVLFAPLFSSELKTLRKTNDRR